VDDESAGHAEAGDSGDAPEEEQAQAEETAVARPDVSAGDGGSVPNEPQNADTLDNTPTSQRSNGSSGAQGHSTVDTNEMQKQVG